LKSEKYLGAQVCIIVKKIKHIDIPNKGEIADIPTLRIEMEGVNSFNWELFAKQSKETTDSDEEFALDKGASILVKKSGNWKL